MTPSFFGRRQPHDHVDEPRTSSEAEQAGLISRSCVAHLADRSQSPCARLEDRSRLLACAPQQQTDHRRAPSPAFRRYEARIALCSFCVKVPARERRSSLRHAPRGSARLVEAAERLGEMLRSDNLRSAMWADEVIKRHILPETSKHTSGLAGWYSAQEPVDANARPYLVECQLLDRARGPRDGPGVSRFSVRRLWRGQRIRCSAMVIVTNG